MKCSQCEIVNGEKSLLGILGRGEGGGGAASTVGQYDTRALCSIM